MASKLAFADARGTNFDGRIDKRSPSRYYGRECLQEIVLSSRMAGWEQRDQRGLKSFRPSHMVYVINLQWLFRSPHIIILLYY
jgi:hypothetical protein